MTPIQVFRATRSRLLDPTKWTKGAAARDASGRHVASEVGGASNSRACSWCLAAALYIESGGRALYAECIELLEAIVGRPVISFNDHETTKHADVVALLDRGIAKLGGAA